MVAAFIGLVLAGLAVAAASPATASPRAAKNAGPSGKSWIVSDPSAYARAAHSKDWVRTPEGLVNQACVYNVPTGAAVKTESGGTGEIIEHSRVIRRIGVCAHPTLAYPGSGRPGGNASAASPAPAATCNTPTNANWWVESCWKSSTWVTSLTENFSVPSDPQQDGALIFFFPALQDSGEDTILQPILNWGANGSIVTTPNIWYIMSEYAWDGNFVHSNPVHINPPNTVTGTIVASGCNSTGGRCTWSVTTSACANGGCSNGTVSTTLSDVGSDPAFYTVNGGAMEVPRGSGCIETPQGGHEAFRNLSITDSNGFITPSLAPYKGMSPQCSASATASGTSTDLFWSP